MDNQLKPCPFCGSLNISEGEVLSTKPDGGASTQSMCRECGALGPDAHLREGEVDFGDEKATTAWNRRAALPSDAAGAPSDSVLVPLSDLRAIYAAMNHLGDTLNGMDAVVLEDEVATEHGFAAIRRALGEVDENDAAPTPTVAADAAAPSETCAHDYVRSDSVCTECGEKAAQPEGGAPCQGMNCGTNTGDHSPECEAAHAATIAGGRFVKGYAQPDERAAFEAWARTADMPLGMYSATDYADAATQISWDAWQARASQGAKP